jgi:hypothetical protein
MTSQRPRRRWDDHDELERHHLEDDDPGSSSLTCAICGDEVELDVGGRSRFSRRAALEGDYGYEAICAACASEPQLFRRGRHGEPAYVPVDLRVPGVRSH